MEFSCYTILRTLSSKVIGAGVPLLVLSLRFLLRGNQ
jgi:hypothetical protein